MNDTKLWASLRRQLIFPGIILFSLCCLEVSLAIAFPFLSGSLYEQAVRTLDPSLGKRILSAMVAATFIASSAAVLKRAVNSHVRGKAIRHLRMASFRLYRGAKYPLLQEMDNGDTIQRIMSESEMVGNLYSRTAGFCYNCSLLVLVYAILAWYDPRLAAVCLATVAAYVAWNQLWKIPLLRLNESLGKGTGGLYGYAYNFFHGIKQIKAFNMAEHYAGKMRDDLSRLKRDQFRRDAITAILQQGGLIQYRFAFIFLLAMCVHGMSTGQTSLGSYIVLSGFLGFTASPVMEISDFFSAKQVGRAANRRLQMLEELAQEGSGGTLEPVRGGDLEFRDLSFRYAKAGRNALRNISMEIPQGSYVALVGESGCGKTTLVNLLLRLFDAEAGSISLGTMDIRNCDLEKLRAHIGYVSQGIALFDSTIRENIDPESRYTDAEVVHACRRASLAGLLEKLPLGIHARVGDRGCLLSGGEKQRLCLARALCGRPSILILDEPTSALDPETEAAILSSLADLKRQDPELTLFIISHNLEMVKRCDRIFLMGDGLLVASGSHAELVAGVPAYRKLFSLQSYPVPAA